MVATPASSSSWLKRAAPFRSWLPLISRRSLRADVMAGLTGAMVILPQGVAFATIAGMPPAYGLYAGIVPTIIAALFGSSWHLVAGPSTTASLVLFSSLSAFAEPGSMPYVQLALTLAMMVGLLELGLGLSGLGGIVNFISHSVVIGYTASVGLLIIVNQLSNFFGMALPRSSDFVTNLAAFASHWRVISLPSLLVAVVTLATALVARRRASPVPPMLLALVVGSLLAALLDWFWPGAVRVVGALPSGLPPLSHPALDFDIWRMLIPTALAVTVSAANEVVSISRTLAIRSGQDVDANQEFIGQGLANVLGSFFSSYVVSGSFNRSALNYDAGAQTPLAAITSALILAFIILFAMPLAAYLPHSAMAASLMLIGWGLIDFRNIRRIFSTSRSERGIVLTTIVAALFLHIQFAILAGVALSLLVYLHRTSHPRLVARVPNPALGSRKFTDPDPDRALDECPQFRIMRLDGSLFFGAVASFRESLHDFVASAPLAKHLAIVMHGVNFIDVAGAEALTLESRRFRERGGGLYLIRAKNRVLDLLERGHYLEELDAKSIFDSKTAAIRTIYDKLDYDICRSCSLNVYVECARKGRPAPPSDTPPASDKPPVS